MTEQRARKVLFKSQPASSNCSFHPALTAKPAPDQREIPNLPRGSYVWVHSEDANFHFRSPDRCAIPAAGGDYQDLAKLLFKLNGYRPGPVRGWYVVVCTDTDRNWVIGQLCASAFTPVQVFEDMVYSSEAEARARAISLRSNDSGSIRIDTPDVALPALSNPRAKPVRRKRF